METWFIGRGSRLRSSLAFVPTRRLALAIAVMAPLWLFSRWSVGGDIALAALLLVIMAAVLDSAMLPSADDLEVTRRIAATLGVGDREHASYHILSRWGRPILLTVHDELPVALLSSTGGTSEIRVGARDVAESSFEVLGYARGETALGDVALRVRSPYGLVARTLRYQQTDRIEVAPSLEGVRRFRWLAVHQRLAAAGIRDAPRRGEGRSFARLRDYAPGDDPRHIDWKATARRGHVITREFTIEQSQTVYLLLDAGRSMTQLAGAYPRFEYALSSALVLADVAVHAGDRVGLMAFDDQVRALVPAQRGSGALRAIRTALIPLVPTLVEPDYASAFRALALRQRKRALIVLLTDVLDTRAARGLMAYLARGTSHHLAVVVALRNDALDAASKLPTGDRPHSFYSAAAAGELLMERATVLQRMREAGVVVLDVAPDVMAAAIVSQYLELKTRGAL